MRDLVRHVLGSGAPAEIGKGVIADVAVQMTALLVGLLGAYEGFEYQSVDGAGVVAVIGVAQGHDFLAATV